MAESYSVKARLSAVDSGFTSTMRNATSAVSSLGAKIKSGIGFGVLTGIGQQAFSTLANGARDLVGEINNSAKAWKTFDANMQILGKTESEIKSVKSALQQYAQESIYSASDMASTYAQLASVGTKNADKLVTAFGGLAAAAENPTQAMKTLSQQGVQMAAKPTVAWQDFKLMLEQTPAGMAAVAKQMGMTSAELVKSIQAGKVKTDEFFAAIEAVGNSDAFSDLATSYKTVDEAMGGLKETLGNKLTPAFDALSQVAIGGISGIIDKIGKLDSEAIKKAVVDWIEKAKPMWQSFQNAVSKVWAVISGVGKKLAPIFESLRSSVGGALKSVLDNIGKLDASAIVEKVGTAIEKMKPYFEALKSVVTAVAGVIGKVLPYIQKAASAIGGFFLDNAAVISKFIPIIAGAIGAFKGFNLVKSIFGGASASVGGAVSSIGGGLAKVLNSAGAMVKNAGVGISKAFMGIGKGIQSALAGLAPAIKAIGPAAQGMGKGLQAAFKGVGQALRIANPVNILALGAAFAIAAGGIALIATQGEGVAAILGGIGSVVASVGTALGNVLALAIRAVAEALVILAPVMPIIAQSFAMMSPVITAFGEAFSAVAVAVGEALSRIVVAIGEGIARIAEGLAPICEVVANLISKIATVLIDGICRIVEALAPVLPAFTQAFTEVSRIVSEAIVRIVEAIAPYMPEIARMVEATSTAIQAICKVFTTLLEQIAPVVDSVTNLVKQLGNSISEILGSTSELVKSFGEAISGVIDSIGGAISKVLDSIAGIFESIGSAAESAGNGFKRVAEGLELISGLSITSLVKSLGAVGDGLKTMAANSSGVAEAGRGIKDVVTALKNVAKAGSSASSAIAELSSAFASAATAATTAGQLIGTGFASGVDNGMDAAKTAATRGISTMNSTFRSGYSRAYQSGAYISVGFANGLLSMLSTVKSAVKQIVDEANKAIEARAKIGSPSKITTQYGKWYGEGYVNGISSMAKDAWNAAQDLVSFPQLATPDLAMAYGGELSSEYSYSRSGEYVIEVPLSVDGREFAKATATYTQEELDKYQTRENRKRGRV